MALMMKGLSFKEMLTYLDNVLVYSSTFHGHLAALSRVFDHLRQHGIKLKPEKCSFCLYQVKYLSYLISHQGISPDPSNISAIVELLPPCTVKQLQQFLGKVSYYKRFIKDRSEIEEPLFDAIKESSHKKSSVLCWSVECAMAFDKLKSILASPEVMMYPYFDRPFIVDVDASKYALGVVISQYNDSQAEHPVAYDSTTLNKEQCNYSPTEWERLALV